MFLAEPTPTQWDLHFRLFGFGVRISPWFWLSNLIFGWGFAQFWMHFSLGALSAGFALAIWTGAVLVSIVIHELGHAIAFRCYGITADIVLYQFGGIAIPRGSMSFGRQRSLTSLHSIVISFAGPALQMICGIVVVAGFYFYGYLIRNPIWFISQLDFLETGKQISSFALWALEDAFAFASIWWALMNLLPVYPLDGGQISREVFTLSSPREGIRHSLILSIITGAAVAIWAWTQQHDMYLAIMFGMLAYSSFATLQAYMGRGGGFGNPW